jgi:hypothetical protein
MPPFSLIIKNATQNPNKQTLLNTFNWEFFLVKTRLANFLNQKFGKKKRPDTSPTKINHNPPEKHARWMLCG